MMFVSRLHSFLTLLNSLRTVPRVTSDSFSGAYGRARVLLETLHLADLVVDHQGLLQMIPVFF